MKIYLALLFFLSSIYCTAQHFEYTNDEAGNRTHRNFSIPRLVNPDLAIIEKKYGVKVFPNPTPNVVNVNIESLEVGETAKVYLTDEMGKILLQREQVSKLESIELMYLKAGIYYIKIYFRSDEISYKLVKL